MKFVLYFIKTRCMYRQWNNYGPHVFASFGNEMAASILCVMMTTVTPSPHEIHSIPHFPLPRHIYMHAYRLPYLYLILVIYVLYWLRDRCSSLPHIYALVCIHLLK